MCVCVLQSASASKPGEARPTHTHALGRTTLFLAYFCLFSTCTKYIYPAIRARGFVLELLEFPGVELAVSQTRGWGELERLSTELQE